MYTFYSGNILYIMFISCGEYARRYTTHWTESNLVLIQVGARWVLVLVSEWCAKTGAREVAAHHKATVRLCRAVGSPHLLRDQGHCDTGLSQKTFFKKLSNFVDYKDFL